MQDRTDCTYDGSVCGPCQGDLQPQLTTRRWESEDFEVEADFDGLLLAPGQRRLWDELPNRQARALGLLREPLRNVSAQLTSTKA